MGLMSDFWTATSPGPRTAARVFDTLIAVIGIICIAVGSYYPASGFIYYITLGVSALWSAFASYVNQTGRNVHPAFFIVLDFALAGVHYAFGIINAWAATGAFYRNGNAIMAVFLIVVGFLHTLFFILACRDTHVRRRSAALNAAKVGQENNNV